MSDLLIHNPHDFLVKEAFSHQEVMEGFLASRLPEEALKRIDLSSLRLTNKSFRTKKGEERHADLIYAATINEQDGYLYISLEHQSKEEEYMPLRQLEYNVLLMRQHLKEGHKTLPLIINICLYNGLKLYKGPVTLLELLNDAETAKRYLVEGYYLVDLRKDSIEKIKRDKKAALAELVLKQAKFRDFCNWIDKNEVLLSLLAGPYNAAVYKYIYALYPDKKAILECIERLKDPTQRQLAMTVAQQLRQEGRQEGIQEGRHAKSLEIARNMLSKLHLDVKVVKEATGLSEEEILKLQGEVKS